MSLIEYMMARNQARAYTDSQRLGYKETQTVEIFPETLMLFVDGRSEEFPINAIPNKGDKVILNVAGVKCIGTAREEDGAVIFVGNGAKMDCSETDDNFGVGFINYNGYLIGFMAIYDGLGLDGDGEYTVSISMETDIVHKIDTVYLAPPVISGTSISLELGEEIRQRAMDGAVPFVYKEKANDITVVYTPITAADFKTVMKFDIVSSKTLKNMNFIFNENDVTVEII